MRVEAAGADGEWIRGALERFEAPLTLYATRLLGDVHRARDVVQDAFLRLCRERRAKVEGRLPAWLYAVARNRAIDERRHDRVAASVGLPSDGVARGDDPRPRSRRATRRTGRSRRSTRSPRRSRRRSG
jgi:RNA polymerase sigma-70 factor (ECF subfamily)